MRFCLVVLASALLVPPGSAGAQEPDALNWAAALAGRYREFHNPVVRTNATAGLATLVCARDRGAASALFREALAGVDLLPDNAFSDTTQVLPVSSLSGLWKSVLPAAVRCDAAFARYAPGERIQARLTEERQQANYYLSVAMGALDDAPDRAAQMADAALDAGDPAAFSMALLTRFLCELRDRAPELADDLFPKALDFVASAPNPSPRMLAELGKYLFTAPQHLERPDKDEAQQSYRIGSSTVPILTATRHSTNADDVKAYIDAAVTVLKATGSSYYDPVMAYGIGYQMLAKAGDVAPGDVDALNRGLAAIESLVGKNAAVIRSAYSPAGPPDAEGGDAARRRDRTIRGVFGAVNARHFDQARDLLRSLDVQATRGQIAALIDFAEAGEDIGARDTEHATQLANGLRGGVKRSLLYAGIISVAGREAALSVFQLVMKDAEGLPAEQRIAVLAATAQALLGVDVDSGLLVLNRLVAAANDATAEPHRGRFDPRIASAGAPTSDSQLILSGRRGMYEVVDAGQNREYFPLKVPGVDAFSLPALVGSAKSVDPARVESVLEEVHDENRQAAALNALAAVRLRGAK